MFAKLFSIVQCQKDHTGGPSVRCYNKVEDKTVKFRFLRCHVTSSRGVQIEISLQITFRHVMVMKHRAGPHSRGLSARTAPMQRRPTLRLVGRTPVRRHDHVVPLVERRRGEPDPVRV